MSGAAGEGRPEDETAELLARGLAAGAWVPPAAETLAGAFPGLRVEALAGRGGMGAVYRARQTRLGRTVAVKIMPKGASPDPMARERFEREARVLSEIDHPQVMRIYDFGALEDGTLYLVTEWAEGGDLAKLAGGRAQAPGQVCEWVGQIAVALDAVHAKGVVHRDLKPANVLVRADGGLALADFGLARAQGAGFTTELTLSGVIFGTLDYMAPEQLGTGKPVSAATDIYALGVMSYAMLTGSLPRGVFTRASLLAGVPVEVDEVINQALANDPAQRPGSAGEFARRLGGACQKRRPNKARAWILGGAVLAGVVAAAVWVVLARPGAGVVAEPGPKPETAIMSPRPAETANPVVETVAPAEVKNDEQGPVAAMSPAPVERVRVETASVERQVPVERLAPAPVVVPAPVPTPVEKAAPVEAPWTWVLPLVRTSEHATGGGWVLRGGELVTDAAVCTLRLPVTVSSDFRYDVAVEFTRTAGKNSVGVFLPTSAGAGVFELDAWEKGLGGIQMVDGRDMRAHGEHFPAVLRNGERTRLILQVRGARVEALVNGVSRRSWDLTGRRFTNVSLWGAGANGGLGLCSWRSPTTFHRVAYRAVP